MELGDGAGKVVGFRRRHGLIKGNCDGRMVTIVGKEGCYLSSGVDGVVVGELGQRQEFPPVVLPVVAVQPEVLLKRLVSPLSLAVGLGVICGRWIAFNVQELVQLPHHFCVKLNPSVMDDLLW